jgi:Domain of unknown function (DUF2479).
MITQTYRLPITPGGVNPVVHVTQYDTGSRTLVFNLRSDTGSFNAPSNAVATCDGTKPDGLGFSYACTLSGSTVTVTIADQMTAVAGDTDCQITITSGNEVIGTAKFTLSVSPAAVNDDTVISDSEISSFTTLSQLVTSKASAASPSAPSVRTPACNLQKSKTPKGATP